ncbi:MAG: APC family permease [Cyanobacteria bacterium]|nr:APC family permease [Cyanobacteriota bacterium]MDW8202566.1 APC family permease [Cyanobacteriota bacterium SKYGB_h_bin112]
MTTLPPTRLRRQVGLSGAILMGLGSIVGTGVFVSIGIAAGIAGAAMIVGVVVGALIALSNGFNSAQLAASHPVSGGSYEYGYKYLSSWAGFTAGWMFLWAKTASAATAALGFSSYLLVAIGLDGRGLTVPIAVGSVVVLTAIVLGGIQGSNRANTVIVSITLTALLTLVLAGIPTAWTMGHQHLTPFVATASGAPVNPIAAVLHASALMFVAYTGYGRIATLGEEVVEPRRIIPRAIVITMLITLVLYVAVALVSVATVGAPVLSAAVTNGSAPLEFVARATGIPGVPQLVTIGAITAMLGVLLNLLLGLSRVLLAMGRRGDMPRCMAQLNAKGTTPPWAVVTVGSTIVLLALVGNVKTTWSFSAFTVLIYYAITNVAALKIPASQLLYPRWLAWVGLVGCLFLAFWVDRQIWLIGLGIIALGLVWHWAAQSARRE